MNDSLILTIFIALGIGSALFLLTYWLQKNRREAFRQVALRTGLTYRADSDRQLGRQYEFLNALGTGSNRYATHIFTGSIDGLSVVAFEYHYQTESSSSNGSRTTHHYISVFSTTLPRSFPELTIRPEGIFSKIAQAVGYDDIDFESAEFSRRYCVRCRDKRLAYDVCHPLAMEFLLRFHDLDIEIEGTTLAAIQRGSLRPQNVESSLRRLLAFRRLLPEYLLKG
jgi:hypothetical protein